MTRLTTVLRFVAACIALVVLVITLILARRFFSKEVATQAPKNTIEALIPAPAVSEEARLALLQKLEVENVPDVTLGERAFESACEALERGDFILAEEKLKYVMTYYPQAPSAAEARRIVEEMQMDRLFSGEEFSEITTYEVKKGDSFYKIIREHETNFDLLVYLNDLKRTDRLFPGDTFQLMKLQFRFVIDVSQNVLSLWSGSRRVKSYSILSNNLPKSKTPRKAQVEAIDSFFEGKRVNAFEEGFRNADKVIILRDPYVAMRTYKASTSNKEGSGIYLASEDIEELALLMRKGNSVEIRY